MHTYRALLDAMRPAPVTIRTFDAGEERGGPASRGAGHRDRFGLRGVRAARHHDDRFQTQIRALLRASAHGPLRILLPFVTSAEELRQLRAVIEQTSRELGVGRDVPVGAMIEVPAAALTVDLLARHADFLSVGTNDLIQYTLAVDRSDERMAGYYEPTAPAVLRLLRRAAVAARTRRCPDFRLRRNGGRPRARGIAGGAGVPVLQHGAVSHSGGEAGIVAARQPGGRAHGTGGAAGLVAGSRQTLIEPLAPAMRQRDRN